MKKSHLFNIVRSPDVDPNEGVPSPLDRPHHRPSTRFNLHIWIEVWEKQWHIRILNGNFDKTSGTSWRWFARSHLMCGRTFVSVVQTIYHSRTRSLGVLQIPNSSSGSFWLLVILRPSFLRHSGQVKIQLQTHKVLGQAMVIAVTKCIYTLYAQFLPLTLTVGERGGFFVDDRQGRNCVFYKVGKAELKRIKLGKLD